MYTKILKYKNNEASIQITSGKTLIDGLVFRIEVKGIDNLFYYYVEIAGITAGTIYDIETMFKDYIESDSCNSPDKLLLSSGFHWDYENKM